jgi:hypothetical protein
MMWFLGENHNGYYDGSLYVQIENMNIRKHFIHFEYSLDTLYGLGTWMSTRKLIHTLKLTSHCEWKEWPYREVNVVIE